MENTTLPKVRNSRMSQMGLERDALGYVDGMNRYEFERANPINMVDPSGLAAATTTQAAGGPNPLRADVKNLFLDQIMVANIRKALGNKVKCPDGYAVVAFQVNSIDRVRVYNHAPQRQVYVVVKGTYRTAKDAIETLNINGADYDGINVYAAHARVWGEVSWKCNCSKKPDQDGGKLKFSFYSRGHHVAPKNEIDAAAALLLAKFKAANPGASGFNTTVDIEGNVPPSGMTTLDYDYILWAGNMNRLSDELRVGEQEGQGFGLFEDSGP
jgi:hypothetical protein